MPVTVMQNTGDPSLKADVVASVEHVLSARPWGLAGHIVVTGWEGAWEIAGLRDRWLRWGRLAHSYETCAACPERADFTPSRVQIFERNFTSLSSGVRIFVAWAFRGLVELALPLLRPRSLSLGI